MNSRKKWMLLLFSLLIFNLIGCGSKKEEPKENGIKPYSESLEGVYADYIFVPIDGNSYRYKVDTILDDGTKPGDKLFEFVETDDWGNETNWTIYTNPEDPEHETLIADTGRLGILKLVYAPSLGVSEEEIRAAREAGFVIMENGENDGEDPAWMDFIRKCDAGETADIRLGFLYTDDAYNMSEDLIISTKEDYPSLFLSELSYDKEQYTIRPVNHMDGEYVPYERPGIDSPEQNFSYLLHFDDSDAERYVLTNDDSLTWEIITSFMLFGDIDAEADHRLVYTIKK